MVHQDEPGVVVGARRNSPLVIGLGDGENFLGSDVAAFVEHTRRAMEIGQDQIVTIRPDSVEVTDFAGNVVPSREFEIAWDAAAASEGRLAELHEEGDQRGAAGGRQHAARPRARGQGDAAGTGRDARHPGRVDRVVVLACGTAAYAGMIGKYAIEKWARLPVEVELSHEFGYRDPVIDERTLVVSVSQSGETMDTLLAVRAAREQGARTISICNTQGSTIPRESDAALYTHAGPEVAVASTKAFVAQITALYLLGLFLAELRGRMSADDLAAQLTELQDVPDKLDQVVESVPGRIAEFAHWMADTQSVLFLGRNVGFPIALEGALKLKELAYIHAEGFAAGELKHGPIALIEPGQIVFVLVPSPRNDGSLNKKVVSNIQEIRARGARVIAVAEIGDVSVVPFADEVIRIPFAAPMFEPLLAVVPLHVSRWSWPPPRVSTSTSHAIWPSPSRWSDVIAGIGVDVVDLARFERAVARTPKLRERLFAESERGLPLQSPGRAIRRQEALIKALGESTGVQWHDMEVVSDEHGKPLLPVSGAVAALAEARAIARLHLSMSHDAGVAVAMVVAEADG